MGLTQSREKSIFWLVSTPAAPAQDITSAVGFCRALVSVMKLKPGGVVCAGVVCSSWITLNRYSAGFFLHDQRGLPRITNSRVWHRNHARCIFPGSFLSLKEERADVRKNGRWVGRYLAARSSLFLKRKLCIKVVSIIMNTGPHMHIWYMDYLGCAPQSCEAVAEVAGLCPVRKFDGEPCHFAALVFCSKIWNHPPSHPHQNTQKPPKRNPPPGGGGGGFLFRLFKCFWKNFGIYMNICWIGLHGG